MRKNILLPEQFADLEIQEEDGYYHFWLKDRCVGYAWKTRTGFATADRPLENLIKSLTPYLKSFDELIKFVDVLREVSIAEISFPNVNETIIKLNDDANIYNELILIKQLSNQYEANKPKKIVVKQAEDEFELLFI